ncbi:MAG: hypothetical protein KDB63_04595 [Nocardioidaceae bacterium]|nr:hypothetical protein [Nocardioidaceae bacterium]
MTTFLVIGVVGLVILTISLLAGDLLDGAFDALAAGDWFSSAVIGGFVSAFGFGGALTLGLGGSMAVAVPVGVAAGAGFGWFAAWLTRLIRGGSSDEVVNPSDAVGHPATVLVEIPEGGFGVVRLRLGGHVLQYNARCDTTQTAGADVYVTEVLSPTAVAVAPVWSELT